MKGIRCLLVLLDLFMVGLGRLGSQSKATSAPCPMVIGIYPVDIRTAAEPLNKQARFEIRQCGSYDIQLLGFKAKDTTPSMVENDGQLAGVIHRGTWIVIQLVAGSSTPTLVAQFRKGIPSLLARVDGDDGIVYNEGSEYATISVPLKHIPDAREGKRRVFRLKTYD